MYAPGARGGVALDWSLDLLFAKDFVQLGDGGTRALMGRPPNGRPRGRGIGILAAARPESES